ncbi:calcium-binding protein [Pseudomonas sp.]|uniref:calcium-binding protein n=1 Tax=Pseudomonas sp. TaxID=306 RepID=UPI003D13A8FE
MLEGGDGTDRLYGGDGNDSLAGELGTDYLYGGNGNDVLLGGEGADNLYGEAGNDILEGGVGNDSLSGGTGSDIYRFSRGWGQDTISNTDSGTNKVDAIVFADDISADDIIVTRSGSNLVLSLKDGSDKITVSRYFSNDGTSSYKLEEIRFANGTTWTIEQVKVMALQGTDGNDVLVGYATDDELAGGLGNDTLLGSAGNNVYRFGLGGGRDVIQGFTDTTVGKHNVLQFEAGIAPDSVIATRSDYSLVLSIRGSSDSITIENFFYSSASGWSAVPIQEIRFSDGTNWAVESGRLSSNGFVGGGENEIFIAANASRANTFVGGQGNDALYGSYYDDTYLFNLGDGQDTIVETSTYSNVTDTVRFGEGIKEADVEVRKVGTDLVFAVGTGSDQLTVKGWFSSAAATASANDSARVEQVQFADGTLWDLGRIQSQVISRGTQDGDVLNGWSGQDTMLGGEGNDTLDGGTGSNQLFGEAGDDVLKVASSARGNVLAGGKGTDTLYGSYYDDTYLFNLGDGQDTIVETSTYSGVRDLLQFGDGIGTEDLWFERNDLDLVISINGTDDRARIQGWYSSSSYRVEEFHTADGKVLLENQVQNLVNAMAAFTSTAGEGGTPSSEQAQQLELVIATNWQ